MDKMLLNSVIRLIMGGVSYYLLQRGFDQGLIDNINGVVTSLIGGSAVAGLALAWSAKDKKAVPRETLMPDNVPRETEPEMVGKGFSLSGRSRKAMVGLEPRLIELLETAIIDAPYDFTVLEGVRTIQRQKALLGEGKSMTLNSLHLIQKDGYGHAFDIGYIHDGILDGRYEIYSAINDHMQAVATRLSIPIRWGGTFKKSNGKPFVDAGHWQLA